VAFHVLKGTVVCVVIISTRAFVLSFPLLSLLYAQIIFSVAIVETPSFKKILPCPLSSRGTWNTRFSFLHPFLSRRAQGFPDVTLLLPPGRWVGVFAGSQIGVCRLVATPSSHSTANFPKKKSFVSSCPPFPEKYLVSGTTSPLIHLLWPAHLQCIASLQPGGAPFPHCFYRGRGCPWQSHSILHPQTPVKSCLV
jgi:hypothetical protein